MIKLVNQIVLIVGRLREWLVGSGLLGSTGIYCDHKKGRIYVPTLLIQVSFFYHNGLLFVAACAQQQDCCVVLIVLIASCYVRVCASRT